MKGIILAGGKGSRLYPSTLSISKQLLPIYDKPLIYYPLSVLMLADIRKILFVCSPDQVDLYQNLLGDGSRLGMEFSYKIQTAPRGIPDAFILGENFIDKDDVCLALGDNILWGDGLTSKLLRAKKVSNGASIFAYPVQNPEEFGVIEMGKNNNPKKIIEKPKKFISNLAVPGIYFYDNSVVQHAKELTPSKRGELEITDINNGYIKRKKIKVNEFGRGFAWLDTGSPELMLEATNFVHMIEKRQGKKIACVEEIAYRKNWVSFKALKNQIRKMPDSSYKRYLKGII